MVMCRLLCLLIVLTFIQNLNSQEKDSKGRKKKDSIQMVCLCTPPCNTCITVEATVNFTYFYIINAHFGYTEL